ncbi:MAG: carbohydrate kinase, partial [Pseudomonadota bacterium]
MTFLVCGEALWDLFAQPSAEGLGYAARLGGSPFNVAVGLSRLGTPAALLTGVSRDALGERIAQALRAEGVSDAHLLRTDRPTTLSLVDLDAAGSPSYAFYGEGAADRALTPADLPAALPDDVWGLHLGSYSVAVDPVGEALATLAAREKGRRLVTYDPNVRPTVEPDLARWRDRIARAASSADVVKVSAEDLEMVFPGEAEAAVVARWHAAGAGLVVITRGAAGAEGFCGDRRVFVPARPVKVADAVGAGDS